jgi:dihydrofolate reductase
VTSEEFVEYNAMPRYVVSTTLATDEPGWTARVLRSLDEVAALEETEGGPAAVHGSAALGASLADAGLIDRYHLSVFPVLIGAGKRLFSEVDKDATKLELVEHEAYSNGIQKQVCQVVRQGCTPACSEVTTGRAGGSVPDGQDRTDYCVGDHGIDPVDQPVGAALGFVDLADQRTNHPNPTPSIAPSTMPSASVSTPRPATSKPMTTVVTR